MPKILSQAGKSLADVYDVVGSIAGIDDLNSREVQLTHDMASTIFSERMSSRIVSTSTGATAQDEDIDIEVPGLPDTPFRVHGVNLTNSGTTTVARLLHMIVVLHDVANDNDIIIWMWNGTIENQRYESDAKEVLMPEPGWQNALPTLGMGGDQPATVPQIIIRGRTLGFGAGTVNIGIRVHFTFSQLEGVSSVGLPIPSW